MIYALFVAGSFLSRFTRFWGDQPDHKFAVGGPQLILRAGPEGVHKVQNRCEVLFKNFPNASEPEVRSIQ